MRSEYSPMQRDSSKALFLGVCLILLFQLKSSVASQKHDYLTEEEVGQLREAQEPPLRMHVFTGILNKRFEKVRLAAPGKTDAKKEVKEESSESKIASQEPPEPNPRSSNPKEGRKKELLETWQEVLNDYLQCMDEVSANVENSKSISLDPKEYLKSLNKLDSFLQKQNQWFKALDIKSLSRTERETAKEILQAQQELAEDLEKAMDQLVEEIKKIKEGKKAKDKKD
jgi:methionine-rich copper-binding protein CopC